jgi:hypothetical protein
MGLDNDMMNAVRLEIRTRIEELDTSAHDYP